jgi:anti-sigma factor RsiW
MNCKAVQNRLSAYLDRELPADDMAAMRAHIHECDACREEERALRSLKSLLCGARTPEPPADLAERLTAAVMAERESTPIRRGLRLPVLTFAGIAACSMALTFVVLSAVRPAETTPTALAKPDSEGLALQIQRDQVYSVGLDATSGAPVISAADYGGR